MPPAPEMLPVFVLCDVAGLGRVLLGRW